MDDTPMCSNPDDRPERPLAKLGRYRAAVRPKSGQGRAAHRLREESLVCCLAEVSE